MRFYMWTVNVDVVFWREFDLCQAPNTATFPKCPTCTLKSLCYAFSRWKAVIFSCWNKDIGNHKPSNIRNLHFINMFISFNFQSKEETTQKMKILKSFIACCTFSNYNCKNEQNFFQYTLIIVSNDDWHFSSFLGINPGKWCPVTVAKSKCISFDKNAFKTFKSLIPVIASPFYKGQNDVKVFKKMFCKKCDKCA